MSDVMCMEFTAWLSTTFLHCTKFEYIMLLCLASSIHTFLGVQFVHVKNKLIVNGSSPVYSQHFCSQDTPNPCIIQHKVLLKSASCSN